ncbi:shikimate kinase [Halobacillus naozhouensis]|uniref:Shikimate kinase n=1 Tax=Halobacillus naozhouensis TaxID=554880 RepID=A0ABY8J3P5_9BACI|nr:shikimate kinase [Halobacillus naozhouensis]WFT75365.1 shikimate kinase [Halobacillus naozhouensis]
MGYIENSLREIPLKEKSIVFVGFMGVGKTTIGKLVAQKLHRSFIDADSEIERKYQMPIPKIFKTLGESEFRKAEKNLITELCHQNLKVISLGGGAFLQEEIRDVCLSHCIVFHLDLSWEMWKERLDMLIETRPVLQGRTIEEIELLFQARRETYADHHSKLITDQLSEEEAANYIVDSLKLSWKLYN